MDFRVLIVQSISLLFWESIMGEGGSDSRELVKEIIKQTPSPENMAGTDDDRENLVALRDICLQMTFLKEQLTRDTLLSKVRLSIKKDTELRDDVNEWLTGNIEDKNVIADKVKYLRTELLTYFQQKEFKDEIKKFAAKTIYNHSGHFNISDMARQIMSTMERFANSATNDEDDPILNGKGDSEDIEELCKHFMNVQDDLAPDSVMKTGWIAFNRMLGEVGGLRRGNMYVIGALPNKGKSYVTSALTLAVPLFNKPYMFDTTKKPAVVHFSTENDLALNMKIWFRYLWENEYNEVCNIQDMTPASMAKWFSEYIGRNGYKFFFYHIDPTNTSYSNITAKLMELETAGYEIHLAAIDYLAMINGDGLGDENRAFWIRQLFKVMRNYCNPRKITLLTPHQVATDAAMYLRQGTDDFVKQIAGKRFWADSRSIDMEVDCEILLNVEKDAQGNSWMSIGRGKDRTSLTTPEKDKFFFLPFNQIGGLRFDLEGKDTSKRTIRDSGGIVPDSEWTNNQPDNQEF